MGMQKKYRQAMKKERALRSGLYLSGSTAGPGLQNSRMRLGYIQDEPKKLSRFYEAYSGNRK